MISDADRTLEKLLQKDFGTALPFDISFAIPNKDFGPLSQGKNTLNCYLYDIQEDRDRRSPLPVIQRQADGVYERVQPPARIKLSYAITAWSPAEVTVGVFPALDEHSLLSEVLAALLRYPTLPADVLVGKLVGQIPDPPTTVVMPAGGTSSSDFWNAIGGELRPSLDYAMTISLAYQADIVGDLVRSAVIDYGEGEILHLVAGTVSGSAALAGPVAAAWLRVDETGATYVTDGDGHFVIDRLVPGAYTLRVRAVGFQEHVLAVDVPQPDGNYDMTLIAL